MPESHTKGPRNPEKRELTDEEVNLLKFVTAGNPNLSAQIESLKIVGKCVCGCWTVAFGRTYQDKPVDGDPWKSGFQGRAEIGTLVGVHLTLDGDDIVELEGIGWDG